MQPINTDHLKRRVKKWAEEIGLQEAQKKMINKGLSFSLAYQLSMGTYPSEPKERVLEVLLELVK